MSLSQFFAILRARWKVMLMVFSAVVAGTVGVSLLLPKKYTATAAVLVDVKGVDPISGMLSPTMGSPAYMTTQVDVIKSERVAQRVVRQLKMNQSGPMAEQWRTETGGKGNFDAWLGDLLQASLDVKPSRESNVITLNYKSVDPKFAVGLANAFAQAYIDTALELRVEPARQYSSFFDERSKKLREELEAAQAKLSIFQKDNDIVATDERLDVENSRLAELSSQLTVMQALSAESRSRETQAEAHPDKIQDVLANPVVAGLRSDLSRQEARFQELSSRLGENHPQVRELRANIGELRSKLESETSRVSGSVGVNNNINRSRQTQIQASLADQRAKVLRLKQVRDQQSVLLREVDAAQRAYDSVMARQSQTQLESHSTQTNVLLLNAATEPNQASSPKVQLNALLAVFVGTLLATGIALVMELIDRRVLTPDDVSQSLDVPVIAVVPDRLRLQRNWFGRRRQRTTGLQRRLLGRLPHSPQGAA